MDAGGAEFDVLSTARTETSAPATSSAKTKKKKARRSRDAELGYCNTAMASEQRASSRTERDDAVSSSARPSRHHNHARASDASRFEQSSASAIAATESFVPSQQRTASLSRTLGSSGGGAAQHRRLSSTPKRDQTTHKPEIAAALLARQSLTSSASALRPSKQRLERTRLLSRAHIECRAQLEHYSHSNASDNNSFDLNDGGDGDDGSNNNSNGGSGFEQPESASGLDVGGDWEHDSTAAPRAAVLPSRARLYRNPLPRRDRSLVSDNEIPADDDGVNAQREPKSSRASRAVKTSNTPHSDRPPSRQRHAFPTHLVDSNSLFTQPSSGSSSNNDHASREKKVRSATATAPCDATATERPPSRYMTKAKRSSANLVNTAATSNASSTSPTTQDSSGDSASVSRLPSRRCIDSVYSLNQVNHDPKTDGFADVDESVPPPFRIEITTDSHHHAAPPVGLRYDRHQHQQQSPRVSPTCVTTASLARGPAPSADRSDLQSRRWSSFSNQEQLAQHTVLEPDRDDRMHNFSSSLYGGGDGDEGSSNMNTEQDTVGRKKPLEWFGHDDQINNAHLFETVGSLPSPRGELDFDSFSPHSPASSSPRSSSSSSPSSSSVDATRLESARSVRGPSARAMPRSAASDRQQRQHISDQQWILASSNPFFYSASDAHASNKFDDMDPETAIAQTPLYEPGDLVTIATEMSDLHLDDFIMGELQPMPFSIALAPGSVITRTPGATADGAASSGAGGRPASRPLHTSLGKDFLSLFAQH